MVKYLFKLNNGNKKMVCSVSVIKHINELDLFKVNSKNSIAEPGDIISMTLFVNLEHIQQKHSAH